MVSISIVYVFATTLLLIINQAASTGVAPQTKPAESYLQVKRNVNVVRTPVAKKVKEEVVPNPGLAEDFVVRSRSPKIQAPTEIKDLGKELEAALGTVQPKEEKIQAPSEPVDVVRMRKASEDSVTSSFIEVEAAKDAVDVVRTRKSSQQKAPRVGPVSEQEKMEQKLEKAVSKLPQGVMSLVELSHDGELSDHEPNLPGEASETPTEVAANLGEYTVVRTVNQPRNPVRRSIQVHDKKVAQVPKPEDAVDVVRSRKTTAGA